MNEMRMALPAKLCPPRLARVYPRARLFERLHAMRESPLTVVRGSAGMGKTTLVASYLRAHALPALWMRLDVSDDDPAVLFGNMRLLAQHALDISIPAFEPSHLADLNSYVGQVLRTLRAAPCVPHVLVFDDYHELSARNPLHASLQAALGLLGDGWRVVVTSRSPVPQADGAGEGLAEMGVEELRLTAEEARGLFSELGGEGVSRAVHLHGITEGWTAGFVLMARSAADGAAPSGDVVLAAAEQLRPYFQTQVLDRLPAAQRTLLLRTALLPEVSPDMAMRMCRDGAGVPVLEQLAAEQLFVARAEGAAPVYRYHALFRDFLLHTLAKSFPADELRALRALAAETLEAGGDIEAAFGLHLEAGQLERAIGLLLQRAPRLMDEGKWATLITWIAKLPQAVQDSSPWIVFWQAAAGTATNPINARAALERAYDMFERDGQPFGQLLCACGVVQAYFLASSSFVGIQQWSERLDVLLQRITAFPDVDTELRIYASALAAEAHCRTGSDFARAAAARVRVLLDREPSVPVQAFALSALCMYLLWISDFRGLRALRPQLDRLRALPQVRPADRVWLAMTAWFGLSWGEGNPRAALEVMDDAVAKARDEGATALAGTCDLFRLTLLASHGTLDEVEAATQRLLPAAGRLRPLDEARFWFSVSLGSLRQQRLQLALEQADRAAGLVEGSGVPNLRFFMRLHRARVLADLQRHEEASRILDNAHAPLREAGLQIEEMDTDCIRAYLAWQRGDRDACLAHLRQGLRIGKAIGALNLIIWVPHQVEPLLQLAIEHGIETDYVTELVHLHRVPAPQPHGDRWPWRLRVHTLGGFRMLVDGETLQEGRKASKRLHTVLQALVAAGPHEVSMALLAEHVWPESDGASAMRSLNAAIHRLRQQLGATDILSVSEGRVSLDASRCWVDAWALEHLLDTELSAALANGNAAQCEAAAKAAIGLHGGAFLKEESDAPWVQVMRQRLQSKLIHGLLGSACMLSDAGRHEAALNVCRAALERDPASELSHRTLMRLHLQMGDRDAALDTYLACERAMKPLGVGPGPEMRAMLQLPPNP